MSAAARSLLLVEDDSNDVFFLQTAFENVGLKVPMPVVEDGNQAIEYLAGEGKYADRSRFPFPNVVLLDLKLPGKSGFDVLRWVKTRPELQTLLVVVLSSSKDPTDVDQAYRLGARSYLVKPISSGPRLEMAKAIKSYWLELNVTPPFPAISAASKPGSIPSPV